MGTLFLKALDRVESSLIDNPVFGFFAGDMLALLPSCASSMSGGVVRRPSSTVRW